MICAGGVAPVPIDRTDREGRGGAATSSGARLVNEDPARHRPGTYQRGEDTRRRILDAAIEIFAADGYEGAATRTLAEQAGVNLPAIQYYFGSKEGLYRAVIDHFIQEIDQRVAPTAERVAAALSGSELPRKELLALLYGMLDAFAVLVVGGGNGRQSRRLFIARAEIERTAALAPLHESLMRQIVRPCATLIGRLTERPAEEEETIVRTLAILGQITIFCSEPARRALGRLDLDESCLKTIQALVRQQTEAILRAARGAKP